MAVVNPSTNDQDGGADLDFARGIFSEYSSALQALGAGLDEGFVHAVRLVLDCKGRLIVGGLGKSGHVARKLAATFSSTGTPSFFLHLSEALHGDLGAVQPGDVGLLLSQSGQTPELVEVTSYMRESGVPVVGISSNPGSSLLLAADARILLPPWDEVCPEDLAPTTSTLMMVAVGDALAMTVMRARGFGRTDFRRIHPAGALGARLKPVSNLMRRGEELPLVRPDTPMLEAVVEMTAKRLGMVGVVDESGLLIGIITDGDLRRNLATLSHATAAEIMTCNPKVVRPITMAEDALAILTRHKITVLFVVDDPTLPKPVGVVHIHDLSPVASAG